jgi:triosephosphate isomerase
MRRGISGEESAMRPLIAGNWKMNGLTADSAALAAAIGKAAGGVSCDLLVCPPATQLGAVVAILAGSGVAVGGQDCHEAAAGAHTGDVSAPMLADLGVTHVILGHSERRAEHGETSARVREKVAAALACGLVPVVCVGESEAERQSGGADQVVATQLAESLPKGFAGVVAYEPLWAIGSGRTPSLAEVAAMHGWIRARLRLISPAEGARVRILYGGSVKPGNAAEMLHLPEVGGALVGGASLQAADFLAIARAAG